MKKIMITILTVIIFTMILSLANPFVFSIVCLPEGFYVYLFNIGIIIYIIYKLINSSSIRLTSFVLLLFLIYILSFCLLYIIYICYELNNTKNIVFICLIPFLAIMPINSIFNDNQNIKKRKEKKSNENILYTNLILGSKDIPIHTEVILKNKEKNKTISLEYILNQKTNIIDIFYDDIKDITYKTDMKMEKTGIDIDKKTRLQQSGHSIFKTIGLNNIYEKVNFNPIYNITIAAIHNKKEVKFILETEDNPEKFIEKIKRSSK